MNCGNVYEDESEKIIEGCECGCSLFMYEKDAELSQEELKQEKEELEDDIREMVREGKETKENIEIKFDLDSIKVQEDGVYNINISRLLNEMPLIIERTEGSYHIHLPSAFTKDKSELDIRTL